MVTEITRKCLFDLVRDWQTSQSEICTQGEQPLTGVDTSSMCGDPGSYTGAQGGLYSAENVFSDFRAGFMFSNSEPSGLHGKSMIQLSTNPSCGPTQLGDWTQNVTTESLMDGASELKDTQISSFVCLRFPQHPEQATYSGKGKGPESEDLRFCLECFPNSLTEP